MHKLLERQLKRHFGSLDKVPAGLLPFLEMVDESYRSNDDDRALLERSLEISSEELVRRNIALVQRESELKCANARLENLNSFRTRFINTAAHELGTPLTPMKLQLYMLRKSLERNPALSPADLKGLETLARNTERLAALVKDILDAAKLQADRLALSLGDVDVAAALEEAAEAFRAASDHAGIRIEVDVGPDLVAQGDPGRLAQVLMNLLGNAIKFTPPGGLVRLAASREGDHVLVSVADSGAGISRENIDRLFQPFSQVHDLGDASKGGTGLGLYVCKGIVEASGGRIWCESKGPDQGATFLFTLPLPSARPAEAEPVAETDSAPGLT